MDQNGFIPDDEFIPDTSGYTPTQQMGAEGLKKIGNAAIEAAKAVIGDQKPPGEFEKGGGGIIGGGVLDAPLSPIDFISPQMVGKAATGAVKGAIAAGKGAATVGKEFAEAAPRILRSEVGSVRIPTPVTKPNEMGFYSKLEQTIADKMGGSATPDQIRAMMMNAQVKPEEIEYSQINKFLEGKDKVSKQEILDFVQSNRLPVQEKILGFTASDDLQKRLQQLQQIPAELRTLRQQNELEDILEGNWTGPQIEKNIGQTKFSQYTLPGGENYREKLYTLPPDLKKNLNIEDLKNKLSNEGFGKDFNKLSSRQQQQIISDIETETSLTKTNYRSSHWDDPNVLAHTRLNDRIDEQGKKHLFVEEIQSDWHQAGRRRGYKTGKSTQEIHNQRESLYKRREELRKSGDTDSQEYKDINDKIEQYGKEMIAEKEGVPDAPLKKTWHEFVSKNLLNDAAKGGYDNISWTTGAQQADRYNLSKYINEIKYSPYTSFDRKTGKPLGELGDKFNVDIIDKDGRLDRRIGMSIDEIKELAGQDIAKKMIAGEGTAKGGGKTLSGLDLSVGGEGMKGFYDKMIPDYMAKIGKKYGVKPEKVSLSGTKKAGYYDIGTDLYGDTSVVFVPEGTMDREVVKSFERLEDAEKFLKQVEKDKGEQVWTMKITPEMRKDILEKGFSLFSIGGATLMGQDANAQQPQGYAYGGIVQGYANGGIVGQFQQDPNFIPDDQFVSDEERFGAPSEMFKTFAQRAASTATFGVSDQLLAQSGLMDVEKARLREETNPGSAILGDVAGIVGSIAAGPATPVSAAARAAEATTQAVLPSVTKAATRLVNPDLYPKAHKILSQAGATALGSALEGAVYGAGKSISEDALGDHELNAESLFSNVGIGTLYGLGAGAVAGGIMGAIKPKAATSAKDILDNAGVEQSADFISTVVNSSKDPKFKEGIISGLAKKKNNIKELEESATMLGVDLAAGQISASPTVQDYYSLYAQSPSSYGLAERQKIYTNFQKVSGTIGDVLGGAENVMSKAALGDYLSKSLTAKNEERVSPIKQLYSYLKETGRDIALPEDERLSLMGVVEKWKNDQNFLKGSFGDDFSNKVIDALAEAKNYDQLDSLAKNLYKSVSGYENKWIAQAIRSEIENTADNILIKFADDVSAFDITNEVAMKVAGARAAKSAYKEFMQDAGKVAEALGVKKLYGPQHFFDILAEKTPEQIAQKMFAKENSRFANWFSKNYPEEWQAIIDYQKGKLYSDSLKNGELNFSKAVKAINKLEPEIKKLMFTDKELKMVKAAETWVEAFPANVNPSKTEITRGIRDFFENPKSAILQTGRDFAFKEGFKRLGLSAGETEKYQMLRKIEKQSIDLSKSILTNTRYVLGIADKQVKKSLTMSDDERKKLEENVQEYANNPEKFINDLDKNTERMYSNAPNLTGAFHQKAVIANQFLASKLPTVPDRKPLSGGYQVSKADVSKFMRYVDALNNPSSLLIQIREGNLTKETVEAVRTVYPKIYQMMQTQAMDLISEMDEKEVKKMPYKVKMGLSMLLGADLASGLDAKSIIANQANLANPISKQTGGSQGIQPTQKGLSNISAPKAILTDSQKTLRDIK